MAIAGTVQITGLMAPTFSGDTYPVTDTFYGLDGLRNVGTTVERNAIPGDRRRAGMMVGLSGGTKYYKLREEPWVYDDTDWDELDFGLLVPPISFTADTYVSGMTYNNGTYDLTVSLNDGSSYTQSLAGLASDVFVLSGVYQSTTGVVEFTNNSGGTFDVSGFTTGMTNYYTTQAILSGSTIHFDRTDTSDAYEVDLSPLGTSLSGTSSGATISGFPVKIGFDRAFTTDTAETFVHGMGLNGDTMYDIVVKIRDKDTNEEIGGSIHDFGENQVQITLSQNYLNCRVVIIG
jgi:hypothetical protein